MSLHLAGIICKKSLYKGEKKSNTHWFLLLKIMALDEPHKGHLEMQVNKLNDQKSNILLGK